MANKYKATFILILVSLGFFICYPFQHTFIGGLLTGGFGAAMIGGLADWFAVAALFRRPLGIPFRTAIIPRNRERIFVALTAMVENEILVKENIKKKLDDYNIAGIVIDFVAEHRGKSYIKKILYRFLQDMFAQIKPEELVTMIDHIVICNREKIKGMTYIIDIVEWLIKNGFDNKIMTIMIRQLIMIVKHNEFQLLLTEVFVKVQEIYERGMSRRRFFNQLMNLSPLQIASEVQQTLLTILAKMEAANHPIRQQGKIWLIQFITKCKTDEQFQQKAESWIQTEIVQQLHLGNFIVYEVLDLHKGKIIDNKQIIKWLAPMTDHIDSIVNAFAANESERAKFDHNLKIMLSEWVDTYHNEIGRMVKDSLNEFTNDRLVQLIERRVGNDLQMIRINGSVVGGLVGMVIYLLTFWL